jgi:hypothetical protein
MGDTAVSDRRVPLIRSKLRGPVSRRRVSRAPLLDLVRGDPRKLTLIGAARRVAEHRPGDRGAHGELLKQPD